MTTTKHIHTETSFASLAAQQEATITGNTYVAADGVTRYWAQAGCTRCGIDGVMYHYVISRSPITPAQKDACLREWAALNAKYAAN